MNSDAQQTTGDCPGGHQWHDLADKRICAACLLEAPAEPITPEPADDPKRSQQTTSDRLWWVMPGLLGALAGAIGQTVVIWSWTH